MKAPKAITTTEAKRRQAIEWNKLQARVFRFDSSKADERFFKQGIHEWLVTPWDKKPTWNQLLFNMVHKRNNDGRTLKYCYFHDHQQRVFLSRDFETWATRTRDAIKSVLQQYYA